MTALSGIAAHVSRRVERLKKEEPLTVLRARPFYARVPRDLSPALAPGARIAEVRFADPARGLLVPRANATAADAARAARDAQAAGAVAVAVWVERNFHAGDYAHLDAVRAACPDLLVIARDFVVDAWQIERARAGGADAVELSPELLGPAFDATAAAVRGLGLTPVLLTRDLSVARIGS